MRRYEDLTIEKLEAARALLTTFRDQRQAELDALIADPFGSVQGTFRRQAMADLKLTIRQINEGTPLNAGMARELWELLQHPDIAVLRFACPGLEVVNRHLVILRAEANASEDTTPWPRAFRYTGGAQKMVWDFAEGRRFLQRGDIIELSEQAATNFADRFTPIAETAPDPPIAPDAPASA